MANERPIVVLGAAGFIGRALTARLAASGASVIAVTRSPAVFDPGVAVRVAGPLDAESAWPFLLDGARAVVHLASRAHAPPERGDRWIGAEAATAAALAAAARREGVDRLLLMSSLKVHGEESGEGRFRADDAPAPADPYGRAKLLIEQAMAEAHGAALVVLRPPLVYGPGVKANFRALMRLVASGLPLPLASIANRRSLIFLDNLVALAECALGHADAAGGVFLARDDDEVATPDLVRLIARAMGRQARLLPCPPALLRVGARLAGRGGQARPLLASLAVDDQPTRARLGWHPRVALADGIATTCRWLRGGDGL